MTREDLVVDVDFDREINDCYFRISKQVQEVADKIDAKPFFIGDRVACKRRTVQYGPTGLDHLCKSLKSMVVNDKAAWLFVCGRDILAKSIVSLPEGLKEGDRVIVQSTAGESIGVAVVAKKVLGKVTLVKREFDVGEYLRRE